VRKENNSAVSFLSSSFVPSAGWPTYLADVFENISASAIEIYKCAGSRNNILIMAHMQKN
jgi:hypothetical protein